MVALVDKAAEVRQTSFLPIRSIMEKSTIITALARHALTAISGGMAVKYGVDGDTINIIVSGLSALAGVAWSIWEKRQR